LFAHAKQKLGVHFQADHREDRFHIPS